jgi:four helix bundle protein
MSCIPFFPCPFLHCSLFPVPFYGSVNELETHIILSYRVGLSKQEDVEPIVSLLREESRMIIALIKKLE